MELYDFIVFLILLHYYYILMHVQRQRYKQTYTQLSVDGVSKKEIEPELITSGVLRLWWWGSVLRIKNSLYGVIKFNEIFTCGALWLEVTGRGFNYLVCGGLGASLCSKHDLFTLMKWRDLGDVDVVSYLTI